MKKSSTVYPQYSVLMSVYKNDNPGWLQLAIDSMLNQTIAPSEFIIIKDGPLPANLNGIIQDYQSNHPNTFQVISLAKNLGLGPALKLGIEKCQNELIARMDADDYSIPTRIEEQLKILIAHPNLHLVGSNVIEFSGDIAHPVSEVVLPENQEQILHFAKKRCPFRHPAILYKKSAVLQAGNYHDCYLCEDYDLYIRMLQSGCQCYNLQKPLTYMRVDDNFYRRRGGTKYLRSILNFKQKQVTNGFFSKKDFIVSSVPHIITCLIPNNLRTFIYKNVLRKKPNSSCPQEQSSSPIRILQIVPNMQAGGLESFIMNIYRNLDRKQIQFDFLVHYQNRKHFDDEIEKLGGRIYRFSLRDDNNLPRYIHNLKTFYKEHPEYKIIHCHMNSIGFIHFMIAKHAGVKVRIAHSHNSSVDHTPKGYLKSFMLRFVKNASTCNLACSQAAGKYLFKNRAFTIIPNAIDLQKFQFDPQKRATYRRQHHLEDELVIGHIGRFEPQKNHRFLINVFNSIHSKNPKSKLLLAGEGKMRPTVESYAQQLGLSGSVEFLGVVRNPADFYQGIDVFVMPSLFEGLPLVGVEAQAAGLPCFFSDQITQELVLSQNAHFLPLSTSADDWSKMILDNNQHTRKVHLMNPDYDAQTQAKKLTKLYFNLLKDNYA